MCTTNPTFPPTWTTTLPSSCWGYKKNVFISLIAIRVQVISSAIHFQCNLGLKKHLEYASIKQSTYFNSNSSKWWYTLDCGSMQDLLIRRLLSSANKYRWDHYSNIIQWYYEHQINLTFTGGV